MNTSQFFERTLFYDRSPAANEYYERSSDLIFESDVSKCRMEVRYQSYCNMLESTNDAEDGSTSVKQDGKGREGKHEKDTASKEGEPESDMRDVYDSNDNTSLLSCASSTKLPTGLDQRQGEFSPPPYPDFCKRYQAQLPSLLPSAEELTQPITSHQSHVRAAYSILSHISKIQRVHYRVWR